MRKEKIGRGVRRGVSTYRLCSTQAVRSGLGTRAAARSKRAAEGQGCVWREKREGCLRWIGVRVEKGWRGRIRKSWQRICKSEIEVDTTSDGSVRIGYTQLCKMQTNNTPTQ
jgi:hypothetical protein